MSVRTRKRRPDSSREGGFSFVEILMVMGIIAVLAGMVVLVLNIWSRKGPEFDTTNRVQKLAGLVGSWKVHSNGNLPPMDARLLPLAAGGGPEVPRLLNAENAGIEALVQALYWPTFNVDPGLGDKDLSNTDQDAFEPDKAPTANGPTLFEVVDGWGNPLVYFIHTQYGEADQTPPVYVLASGQIVRPRPWKYKDESRGFAEPRGFQIFSMGPDETPNTADDIKSW